MHRRQLTFNLSVSTIKWCPSTDNFQAKTWNKKTLPYEGDQFPSARLLSGDLLVLLKSQYNGEATIKLRISHDCVFPV